MFRLCGNQVVGFTSKMFEKHLWKSDILSKYAGHRQLVFTSKMFEKHLWKSDILGKDAGRWLYLKPHSSTGVFQTFC